MDGLFWDVVHICMRSLLCRVAGNFLFESFLDESSTFCAITDVQHYEVGIKVCVVAVICLLRLVAILINSFALLLVVTD